jgi:hypothetical protein
MFFRMIGAAILVGGAALASQPAHADGVSEAQARHLMIDAGCSNVGTLSRDGNGVWHGVCQKTPLPSRMAVDASGKVMANAPAYGGVSEGQARSALTDASCGNMSSLSQDSNGVWHANCQKAMFPVAMKVGADGKAIPEAGGFSGLTEGHARSILTDAGCSTISGLSLDAAGNWSGSCWKGGAPVLVMVDAGGKVSTR